MNEVVGKTVVIVNEEDFHGGKYGLNCTHVHKGQGMFVHKEIGPCGHGNSRITH